MAENQSRLTQFTYLGPEKDDERRGYLTIVPSKGPLAPSPGDLKMYSDITEGAANYQQLVDLHSEIVGAKYQKFILTSLSLSRQERTQVVPTFGDSFAVMLTGREPMVVSFAGKLIFDSPDAKSWSWYHSFINTYEYYLRGSRLAKHWAVAKLYVPDITGVAGDDGYTGYIMSLAENHTSDTDNVIDISMSMLVVHAPDIKPGVMSTATPVPTPSTGAFKPGTEVLQGDGKVTVKMTEDGKSIDIDAPAIGYRSPYAYNMPTMVPSIQSLLESTPESRAPKPITIEDIQIKTIGKPIAQYGSSTTASSVLNSKGFETFASEATKAISGVPARVGTSVPKINETAVRTVAKLANNPVGAINKDGSLFGVRKEIDKILSSIKPNIFQRNGIM